MITDKETNAIYFSEKLKTDFPKTCTQVIDVLQLNRITPTFLQNTKDIWSRDYMPIQVSEDKFIEYLYEPDYLKDKRQQKYKSDPVTICDSMGLKTTKTNLIIDGGNVIKSTDCVILTDKVIQENIYSYTKDECVNKLKELFEVDKIVLIPWDKEEPYGHADGMIRFINNKTVLVQDYYDEYDEQFKEKFFDALKNNGLSWEKLKFEGKKVDKRSWSYMNFLQTKDVILLPSYGIEEDFLALEQMKIYYPEYSDGKIHQIGMNEIIKGDGGLNCISLTIKK